MPSCAFALKFLFFPIPVQPHWAYLEAAAAIEGRLAVATPIDPVR